MKADLPILMSAPMVQACVREAEEPGTGKTETRRILKPQPFSVALGPGERFVTEEEFLINAKEGRVKSVRFAKGQRLWVKETHALPHAGDAAIKRMGLSAIAYKADEGVKHGRLKQYDGRWKPSIFMRRKYSRLTLDVTDVRVERIQDIRHAGAKAEGVLPFAPHRAPQGGACDGDSSGFDDCARCAFKLLWAQINGPQSWFGNPWVVVITFVPHLHNIDAKP